MIQFKKIILTTDLSDNANAATPYAVELAKRYNGTIHLIHVSEDSLYYAIGTGEKVAPIDPLIQVYDPAWVEEARRFREQQLEKLAKSIGTNDGVTVIHLLQQGHAADKIITYAKAENADCIVIATHGRTGFSHFLFGSVAERVVRMSVCPVLSVRPEKILPMNPQ